MFRAYTPSSGANRGTISLQMLHMSLVLLGAGPEGCAFWWCVCAAAQTHHQNAQPSGPAPNNTKDICSICKEIVPLFAPEDGV